MTLRVRRALTIVSCVLLGLALYFAAGSRAGLDKMRKDFVALRYLQESLAAVSQRPKDRPLAIAKLTRAIELAPDSPAIRATAPQIYVEAGAYATALRLLLPQGETDPYLLGLCLLELGHTERATQLLLATARAAKDAYSRGETSDAAYAMQINNVGYLLADAGLALNEAKAMLETATSTLPLDPNCVDSLGWVHYRLGHYREAVFFLERAVRHLVPPGQAEVYYHLGAGYAREGRITAAKRMLRAALQQDPEYEDAIRELERLNWRLPQPAYTEAGRVACVDPSCAVP